MTRLLSINTRQFFMAFILCSFSQAQANKVPPALQLASTYQHSPHQTQQHAVNLSEYWVSEKYDGVRAYWNGTRFITRQGNRINAPDWFIKNLPNTALDGELWMGRLKFDASSAAIRRIKPNNKEWQRMQYMVFDLPHSDAAFTQRIDAIKAIVSDINQPWVKAVKQFKVPDEKTLFETLDHMSEIGAEGLMLHKGTAFYSHKRSQDLIKLKPLLDDEAIVIGHKPGKGKFDGMMGSLQVKWDNKTFYIGTGFSYAERENPPPPGSEITFEYSGLSKNHLPRFARFKRVRVWH